MNSIDDIFNNHSFDLQKLIDFGFIEKEDRYTYSLPFQNTEFKAEVIIYKNTKITADVIDTETGEKYDLVKVPGATGVFIGKIRAEFKEILTKIVENCFYPDVFQNPYTKETIAYIKNTYNGNPEFLWEKSPENAIFRRKDNAKWYAALLRLSRKKLGFDSDERIDILDLKCTSDVIAKIVDGKKYFPGYHMNKKHWITLCLDGSVPVKEICKRIDDSYALAKK